MKTQSREKEIVLADMMDHLGFEGCKQNFQRGRGKHSRQKPQGVQGHRRDEAGAILEQSEHLWVWGTVSDGESPFLPAQEFGLYVVFTEYQKRFLQDLQDLIYRITTFLHGSAMIPFCLLRR